MCMSVGNNSFHTFLGLSEGNNMGWDWNLINKKTVYYCKKKVIFQNFLVPWCVMFIHGSFYANYVILNVLVVRKWTVHIMPFYSVMQGL